MKLLFITSSRIGDAVLSTGLLRHIIAAHPDARVTVACGPLAQGLFAGVPGLERVIPLKKKSFNRHWWELWRMVAPVRWDMAVDLRNSAVSRLIRARQKFIAAGKYAGHKVAQNAAVMNLSAAPAPHLWFTPAQQQEAARLIPAGSLVLAVAPTANWAGKTWPAENFIALLSSLTVAGGPFAAHRVAVFAAPGEEVQAHRVLDTLPTNRRLDLIAKTDPGTAAAALARCAYFIGNDSGLMHCAAAAGVPTLGLFGPTPADIYGPWGPHCRIVRAETMQQIDVGSVTAAIRAHLAG